MAGVIGTTSYVAFDIGAGETIYTGKTRYCVFEFSLFTNGEEALILFGHRATPILVATSSTLSQISTTDTPDKVCIYKEANGGQIIIKNNCESSVKGSYRIL